MTNKKYNQLHIADLGAFKLELPIIEVGSGAPNVLIVNNIHGNEISGFFVLEALLNILPKKVKGTITIITSANPLGLLERVRNFPPEQVDLNRSFPNPKKERGVAPIFRDKLTELALTQDLIIDIHNFVRPSLSAGLLIKQSSQKNQNLVENCLKALQTQLIIDMPLTGEEKRGSSAFSAEMIRKGKASFIIEFPPASVLTADDIKKLAVGLLDSLEETGIVERTKAADQKEVIIVKRQQILTEQAGLFLPQRQLESRIKEGEILGATIDTKTLKRTPLICPYSGVVAELVGKSFVRFGDKVGTIVAGIRTI